MKLSDLSQNHWKILNAVRSRGYSTRYKIAEDTDIPLTTVFRTAKNLLAHEFLALAEEHDDLELLKDDLVTSTKGPDSYIYKVNPQKGYFLGISIGSMYVNVELIDFDFRVIGINYRKKSGGNFDETIKTVNQLFLEFVTNHPTEFEYLLGIGFSWPGAVDCKNGIAMYSPNINYFRQINIREIIDLENLNSRQKEIMSNIHMVIEHNTSCSILAEKDIGNPSERALPQKNIINLLLSNGVSAGIYMNDEIYSGSNNFAGEIGHVIFDERNDVTCKCGKNGCLEAIISKITKNINNTDDILKSFHDLESEEEKDAMRRDLGKWISKALGILINIFNPELVIIGGHVSELFDIFYLPMMTNLQKECWSFSLQKCEIVQSNLKRTGSAIGAAITAYYALSED
jgi:transcriptional regulator of PTS gene